MAHGRGGDAISRLDGRDPAEWAMRMASGPSSVVLSAVPLGPSPCGWPGVLAVGLVVMLP